MDTKVCQHCGAELTNRRAKNCPVCSEILADANKRGGYGAVKAAIEAAKAEGIQGTDMHQVMRLAMAEGQAAANAWAAKVRKQQQERKERLAARTRYYAEHGRWPGSEMDEEDAERIEAEQVARMDAQTARTPGLELHSEQ